MATPFNRRDNLLRLFVVLLGAVPLPVLTGCEPAPDENSELHRLPITISKETTYITEPLRPDGYPDYVAALNQHCSQGVTPENNAAVLFWKAMGPGEIDKDHRDEYFKMLGMVLLPEKGDYFLSSSDHVSSSTADDWEKSKQLDEQLVIAGRRPWSRQEFPVWAEWLDRNERPMALLAEASKRPRRYDPWFCDEDGCSLFIEIAPLSQYREALRAFAARAMLRTEEGEIDAAWEDIMTCRRLARLFGQGPTLVEALVATVMEITAQTDTWALLHHGKLDAAQIAAMQQEALSLPPLFHMADILDVGERFFCLSMTLATFKQPITERNADLLKTESQCRFLDPSRAENPLFKPILDAVGNASIDCDTVFRLTNTWNDQVVEAIGHPTYAKRKKAIDTIKEQLQDLEKMVKDTKSLKTLPAKELQEVGSERIGQALILLVTSSQLLANNVVNQNEMRSDLTQIAFALAAYRADHDAYPEKLAELTPKYLDHVPKDFFNNDADPHYARQEDGYLLYSVGLNGRDDGGKEIGDCTEGGEGCDDIVVRMPPVDE